MLARRCNKNESAVVAFNELLTHFELGRDEKAISRSAVTKCS